MSEHTEDQIRRAREVLLGAGWLFDEFIADQTAKLLATGLADTERRDFLEICDDRYATRSTILTSQIPLAHWHDQIGDPTVADSILDRVVHNAHRIELQGASMRKTKTVRSSDTDSEPPSGGKKPAA